MQQQKKMSTRFLAEGLMGHRELQLCITNKCVEKKKGEMAGCTGRAAKMEGERCRKR